MYLSFTDKDKKTVHTHSSLLNEEQIKQLKEVEDTRVQWRSVAAVASTYIGIELVNRIKYLNKLNFPLKAAVVGAVTLVGATAAPMAYTKTKGEAEIRRILHGAPVYENKVDVPELDKLYFFLDDDNNYEPSLLHHGLSKPRKAPRIYEHSA